MPVREVSWLQSFLSVIDEAADQRQQNRILVLLVTGDQAHPAGKAGGFGKTDCFTSGAKLSRLAACLDPLSFLAEKQSVGFML